MNISRVFLNGCFRIKKVVIRSKATPAILMAILAAALYGISSPISKLLLKKIPPPFMAALLYLGAGFGMLIVHFVNVCSKKAPTEAKITNKELPFVIGMIILDIAAPIFLMVGLTMAPAENASLLNNFEIVATALIALFLFKESIGKRMWLAILFITLSTIILSVNDLRSLSFSVGSIFVVAACICWGFENNCTRMLSIKNPLQIVIVKGLGSGFGSLVISLVLKEYSKNLLYISLALFLGFIAYGLSIYFYIKAQRELGAARTSTYYATAPFIGVLISWLILKEIITFSFLLAFFIMIIGAYYAVSENHGHSHNHEEMTHEHKHNHEDGHHNHKHINKITGEHCHVHAHEAMCHSHLHTPDLHHRHSH